MSNFNTIKIDPIDLIVHSWSDDMQKAVMSILDSLNDEDIALAEAHEHDPHYRFKTILQDNYVYELLNISHIYTFKVFETQLCSPDYNFLFPFQFDLREEVLKSELNRLDCACFAALHKAMCNDSIEGRLAFIGLAMFLFAHYAVDKYMVNCTYN